MNDFILSGETYTADTLYIEAHKAGDLFLDYICDEKIPIYINFLNDDIVILYNLSRLKHRPTEVAKRIHSKLYQGFELAKREELSLEDAWIYKKENNVYKLIKRPWQNMRRYIWNVWKIIIWNLYRYARMYAIKIGKNTQKIYWMILLYKSIK